jgi:hypothetical protein
MTIVTGSGKILIDPNIKWLADVVRAKSDSTFTVYFFHAPVLVYLTLALNDIDRIHCSS